jgi:D-tyrosyl-tRNA(Tyr) deacylase
MRAIIQRVSNANVVVNNQEHSQINLGLLVLLGVETEDEEEDAQWLSRKVATMRIFNDDEGQMNLSVNEVGGDVLVISQFTLHAKTKKGTRPSFIHAAHPDKAQPLYEKFCALLNAQIENEVKTGVFGADMKVGLTNNGPVTIFIDTKNKT